MFRSSSSSRLRSLAWLIPLLGIAVIGASLLAQGGSPDIKVSSGSTIPLNGTVDFGSSAVGVAKEKTFTVENTGTADLLVAEQITVPQGFTLMASFPGVPDTVLTSTNQEPAFTISPGGTATFKVALNSATSGNFSGNVSFMTNVTGKNPFVFKVTGRATPPPALRIIDDSSAGFTATSGWTQGFSDPSDSGEIAFQGSLSWAGAGTGSEVATWRFTGLEPGQYNVAIT